MPRGMTVDDSETVIADVPDYLINLEKVLASTSKRTVANYFMWRVVFTSSDLLTENLRKRTAAYEAAILGKKIEPPRWKKCVSETTSKLSIAVGGLYVRRYFNEDAKQRAIELVNNVRSEFIHILHDVPWMDEQTKVAAIEKARALQNHIGYPDELDDDAKLEQFYSDLDIDANANNMFENVRNVRKFERNFTFNMLREPVNKTDWRMHSMPSMVNAQYSPLENSIRKLAPTTASWTLVNDGIWTMLTTIMRANSHLLSIRRDSCCYFAREIFLGRASSLSQLRGNRSNNRT